MPELLEEESESLVSELLEDDEVSALRFFFLFVKASSLISGSSSLGSKKAARLCKDHFLVRLVWACTLAEVSKLASQTPWHDWLQGSSRSTLDRIFCPPWGSSAAVFW